MVWIVFGQETLNGNCFNKDTANSRWLKHGVQLYDEKHMMLEVKMSQLVNSRNPVFVKRAGSWIMTHKDQPYFNNMSYAYSGTLVTAKVGRAHLPANWPNPNWIKAIKHKPHPYNFPNPIPFDPKPFSRNKPKLNKKYKVPHSFFTSKNGLLSSP